MVCSEVRGLSISVILCVIELSYDYFSARKLVEWWNRSDESFQPFVEVGLNSQLYKCFGVRLCSNNRRVRYIQRKHWEVMGYIIK